jgi:hypothetical protein
LQAKLNIKNKKIEPISNYKKGGKTNLQLTKTP